MFSFIRFSLIGFFTSSVLSTRVYEYLLLEIILHSVLTYPWIIFSIIVVLYRHHLLIAYSCRKWFLFLIFLALFLPLHKIFLFLFVCSSLPFSKETFMFPLCTLSFSFLLSVVLPVFIWSSSLYLFLFLHYFTHLYISLSLLLFLLYPSTLFARSTQDYFIFL